MAFVLFMHELWDDDPLDHSCCVTSFFTAHCLLLPTFPVCLLSELGIVVFMGVMSY